MAAIKRTISDSARKESLEFGLAIISFYTHPEAAGGYSPWQRLSVTQNITATTILRRRVAVAGGQI